jgi:hypothetical protein
VRSRVAVAVAAAAELFALTGAAIAQPLLDTFGRAPDVFVRADVARSGLWWFAIVVAFGPPIVMVVIEILVAVLAPQAATWLHRAFVVTLIAAIALPLLRDHLGARGAVLIVATAAVASAFAIAHMQWQPIRTWFRFAAPLPLVAAALFLFTAPVSDLAAASSPAPAVALMAEPGAVERPVVLLVLDEFPVSALLDGSGEIDAARFPGFAALASESVWFRNTTTVATHTEQAVPAILTGRYPEAGDAPAVWTEHPDNLFRLLAGSYAMHVDEAATRLCPEAHCPKPERNPTTTSVSAATTTSATTPATAATTAPPTTPTPGTRQDTGLGDVFRLARRQLGDRLALEPVHRVAEAEVTETIESVTTTSPTVPTSTTRPIRPAQVPNATTTVAPEEPPPPPNFGGFVARSLGQPVRFVQFLGDTRADAPTRSFHFLHLLLPHVPWHLTADGHAYQYSNDANLQFPGYSLAWSSQVAADAARVRLAMQAGYADSIVQALVEHLRAIGLWDDAIVVVVADHGISLLDGSRTRGIESGADELLGVPLFVHVPDARGRVDDRPAQTIDLVPTLADLLDVTLPWPVDGVSLFGTARTTTHHPMAIGAIGGPATITDVDVTQHLQWLKGAGRDRSETTTSTGARDPLFLELGLRPDLLGTLASDVDVNAVDVELDFPDRSAFDSVDLDGELPLHVVGHVDDAPPGVLIAIIVNGRIAGVAETFDDDQPRDDQPSDDQPRATFTALLDVRPFHAGENEIRFARIDDGPNSMP